MGHAQMQMDHDWKKMQWYGKHRAQHWQMIPDNHLVSQVYCIQSQYYPLRKPGRFLLLSKPVL
jgi:hypothetical protein